MSDIGSKFSIKQDNTKVVDYFGLPFRIPNKYKYIATDGSGDIYAYIDKPVIGERTHAWGDARYCSLMDVEFEGDWKESLVEV